MSTYTDIPPVASGTAGYFTSILARGYSLSGISPAHAKEVIDPAAGFAEWEISSGTAAHRPVGATTAATIGFVSTPAGSTSDALVLGPSAAAASAQKVIVLDEATPFWLSYMGMFQLGATPSGVFSSVGFEDPNGGKGLRPGFFGSATLNAGVGSDTKFCCLHWNGTTQESVKSTINVDTSPHQIEIWCSGAGYKFSVDQEAALSVPATAPFSNFLAALAWDWFTPGAGSPAFSVGWVAAILPTAW